MKTFSLLATISLALSVSAANQNLQQNNLAGGNRGGFGNNNGFFGQGFGGRNGQNSNQGGRNINNANNGRGNQNTNTNTNKGNQNNNNNKGNATNGTGQNNNNNGAAASSTAAATAASSAAAAAATDASSTAAAASASSTASANSGDAQSSLTLDPNVVATGFENDGQDVPTAGQVASLTSSNNFINFCLTVPNLPITNGKQITTGSCNPAPMGSIPSTDNMPSAKFQVPKNGDTLQENTPFTITMAVANFETGNFVNAEENYFAAPQQLNGQGQIVGHSHVVVEQLSALDQTTPTDPKKFAFFKGLNAAAVNGVLTADVTSGLPAGFYKVSSINTAANHQPVLVPIAQHGSLDDAVYFTVSASGSNSTAAASSAANVAASSSAAAATATAAASSSSVADVAASSSAAAATATAATGKQQQKGGNQQQQKGGNQQQQQKGGNQQQQNRGRSHARAFF